MGTPASTNPTIKNAFAAVDCSRRCAQSSPPRCILRLPTSPEPRVFSARDYFPHHFSLLPLRACLKNHFRNLQAPVCGRFYPHSVAVAHYAALIRIKSPTNWDSQLTKSLFQTRSSIHEKEQKKHSFGTDFLFIISLIKSIFSL